MAGREVLAARITKKPNQNTNTQKERPHHLDQESKHTPEKQTKKKQKQTNINWTNRVTSRRARLSPRTKEEENQKKGKNATTNKHVTIIRSRTRRGGPTSDHPFTPSHTAPLGGGKPGDGPARLALCLCLYVLRSLVTTPDVRRARTCISLTNRTPQPTFGKCLRCRVLVQVQWDATHCSSKLPPGP